jgi:phosphoglucosamine mutase
LSAPRQYFGTDGIRGAFGGPVINERFAARLGLAAARWAGGTGLAVLGRDTRQSGDALAAALARGLVAGGVQPTRLGILPTPAVARATREMGAVLGAVITASHNPASDNGIKFFGSGGRKLGDEEEARLESLLPDAVPDSVAGAAVADSTAAVASYLAAALGVLPPGALRGWRIVLDTANGAACVTSPGVLRTLGADVVGLGDAPDGHNINAGVGSEHPGQLAARVRAEGARLGVAHDGDGDRCVLCDERGSILDGDEILTILATHALARGTLAANALVVTIQSNLGVDAAVRAAGGRVFRSPIGDRYVYECMRAEGATLGGESSGHVICSEISPGGDGLVTALKVIGVMRETGRPLSALRQVLRKFPQAVDSIAVREKRPIAELPALAAAVRRLEEEFGDHGRVLVRYSGTEPKLRLLVEGRDEAAVRAGLDRLRSAAAADLA